MGYIRVRDFAAENNCTAQNIYKHLRNYSSELEGHIIAGPGKQGQLLDDDAQAFLRSVMYPKSIAIDNDAMAAELAEMRAAMMKLGQENLRLAAELATTQGERDRALLEVGQYQRALTASQEAEEAKAAELQQTSEALKQMKDQRLQEAAEAERREQELQSRLEDSEAREKALEDEKEAFLKLPRWKKIFWKG